MNPPPTHVDPPTPASAAVDAPNIPVELQLLLAAQSNHLPTITQLLRLPDINVNWANPELHLLTPLHGSCFFRHPAACRLLLNDPRVEVNPLNAFHSTPFSLACFNDCLPIVQALLGDARTEVNTVNVRGETPLWRAVHSGNTEIIKRMLAGDRMIDTVTQSLQTSVVPHTTPAELARIKNYPELAVVLDEYERNPGKIRFQIRLLLANSVEMAATLYGYVVLYCDEYLRVKSFDDYKVGKDILRLAQSMAIPAPVKDPNMSYYPGIKLTAPLGQEERDDDDNSSSSNSSNTNQGSDSEFDSDNTELAVKTADDLERELEERDWEHYNHLVRFVTIARRLPLELQMILCNHAYLVTKTVIPSTLAEHAFRHAIQLYHP